MPEAQLCRYTYSGWHNAGKRLAPENGICVVVCGTKNKEEVLTHDR